MLEQAIEKVRSLSIEAALPQVLDVHGLPHFRRSDGTVVPILPPAYPTVNVRTLQGFADYCKYSDEGAAIYVLAPDCVRLFGAVEPQFGRRSIVCEAKPFGGDNGASGIDNCRQDEFLVRVATEFLPSPARERLTTLASAITDRSEVMALDNGISQQVTVISGASSIAKNIEVQNPWALAPMASFSPEIQLDSQPFIFRITKTNGGMALSLKAIGDSAWKFDAVQKTKSHLRELLGETKIPVIG